MSRMNRSRRGTGAVALGCLMAAVWAGVVGPAAAQGLSDGLRALRERPPEDEVIYFVLPDRFANGVSSNDRGGMTGDRLVTGYDPTDPGFYHGGDLAGLTARLDYIRGLGATALWLAPVFRNKPVQGPPGQESAAYHGYWITDFTHIDPHLGTDLEFRALVDAAHARGMKVYLDIVINHTADVIQYRECAHGDCGYRWARDYPVRRQGGLSGEPINAGFVGNGTAEDFARLTRPDYAYSPYVPAGEEHLKAPAWLNEVGLYHNRGNSAWYGESALDGDFSGLDDLMTEHPRVVQGFIDVYGSWIDTYGIDGFRIDTAKHVNPEFWQAFVPAILERARAAGIPNFHIFGEVYGFEPGELARHTQVDRLPSVLDFAWQRAVQEAVAGASGPDRIARVINADPVYAGGAAAALRLPTFVGNHDMGRIGHLILKDRPDISDAELLDRAALAHAIMVLGRGVPVIYYGDEQGFTGDGDDRRARQDMFQTRTAAYADDRRIGATSGPYDDKADLYLRIAGLTSARAADVRLRRGRVVVRTADQTPGTLAISRLDGGGETLAVFNTSMEARTVNVTVEASSDVWRSLIGACPVRSAAPGVVTLSLPALGYLVCVSESPA
ncbi:MAG: alpha-amylase family glycosyl hydrolase [Brevundimonas sp.]|uniref:alpha-amylase family glycosyl hydrolase n=1 Tax=Brevundimonas sp. TaxID=1871086 RepID=UPI0027265DBB|nr:alpha-amylase family glycosyl hydrolase [Brevundimonas sp.]MDO9587738.1 alpha-amylase family glycosyl hydrolase [Brevundimonas sp.]